MPTLFPIGQVLKGRIGQYTISKPLQETVWLVVMVWGWQIISLIYGGDFNIFDPPGAAYKIGDLEYESHVLRRQFQFFGQPPPKYAQLFVNERMVEKGAGYQR
jgi:hypothetical protein